VGEVTARHLMQPRIGQPSSKLLPVGRWLDRHGARLLMTAGSCIGVLLVLAWAMTNSLLLLYGLWAGIGLVM
jgi:MFS family permease